MSTFRMSSLLVSMIYGVSNILIIMLAVFSSRVNSTTTPPSPRSDRAAPLLVVFSSEEGAYFRIPCLRGISQAQTSALLAALDLGRKVAGLSVKSNAALEFHALMDFIRRHHSLRELFLEAETIIPASLTLEPLFEATPSPVPNVWAPAVYIPYILPTVRLGGLKSHPHPPHPPYTSRLLSPPSLLSATYHESLRWLTLHLDRPSVHERMLEGIT
ncbi:hypothetical protein C8F04DRAFT_1261879 [Mycena alexandri]|uniref:Uncharacterized protein n=1 Tax=Mycena alexandri TaxID=1745969 RepID=A0AAD6X1S8_9AGAR|nr:hypothetical protein C8F04DRAFT_1261879 [Mycena alexandri]